MAADRLRIVPLASLGDPTGLEPLVRRVFGHGDRAPGWFSRKLRRERVDPRLSPIAIGPDGDPDDPSARVGYVLVGTPLSRGDAVRTAGTGVLPSARGRGVGGRLVDAAAWMAQAAGFRRMELVAARAVLPFYAQQGFAVVHHTVTALAFARGTRPPPGRCRPWRMPLRHEHAPVTWMPETWDGTEPAARAGLRWSTEDGPVDAWLSREGVAWLVQHLVAPAGVGLPRLASTLLEHLPAGAPVMLPLLPAADSALAELLEGEWSVVQRGALMERSLGTTS